MTDTHSSSPADFSALTRQWNSLLQQATSFRDFVEKLLKSIVDLEGIVAAAVYEVPSSGPRFVAGESAANHLMKEDFILNTDLTLKLLEAIRQRSPLAIEYRTSPTDLPRHLLLLAPILSSLPLVLVLFSPPKTRPDRVQSLRNIALILANYLLRFQEQQPKPQASASAPDFWKQFDPFLVKLQQTLDLDVTVAVAVNDGRVLTGCDRMSVALKHGPGARIAGVSGQESVQHRASLMKAMKELASIVLQLGVPLTYAGNMEGLPAQLEAPLARYLAISRTRMVHFCPLRAPVPLVLEDGIPQFQKGEAKRSLLGMLIVEQALDAQPRTGLIERTELIAAHLETALSNCDQHESILFLPFLRRIGNGLRWFRGRRYWTALAISGVLFLGLLGLWLIPWEYRVEGKGRAMPTVQYEVFAPWDADVREIRVESGERVHAGELLVILHSDELHAQEVSLTNELLEKRKLASALTQQQHLARRKNDPAELARLEADFVKANIESEGVESQLKRIRERIEQLSILAPADGVVTTFQLKQLLQNRPVRRGELLLQIMKPDGDWRLELEVPEHRLGHIMEARQRNSLQPLTVDFVLATAVERSLRGKLTEVATRSNELQSEGTIVQAFAQIDSRDLPHQMIGAEVIAKVHCGKKSLFYVLFGDVVEFLQRYLWL